MKNVSPGAAALALAAQSAGYYFLAADLVGSTRMQLSMVRFHRVMALKKKHLIFV